MIDSLADYPSIKKLASALWPRDGKSHGVAVMVGAGFSRCSARHADASKKLPLWTDFGVRLSEELFGKSEKLRFADPLRLAEQYRAYFGQAVLNDLIKSEIQDAAWQPGILHEELLKLPWAEVLTTNWDTLLERASEKIHSPVYGVVAKQSDLSSVSSPRIIKLHGTIGVSEHFVFAQEDYRSYPTKQAAFVNVARQVLIENELCLLGFSGDDPNFLQWAGWVRDHLADHARKVYLVGALNLGPAARKYLESLNVAPIDLSGVVEEVEDVGEKHLQAIEFFLAELKRLEPLPPYHWKLPAGPVPSGSDENFVRYHRDHQFAASLISRHIDVLRREREIYPGWLVCPVDLRARIDHHFSLMGLTSSNFQILSVEDQERFLYEVVWWHQISGRSIKPWLTEELAKVASASMTIAISKRQQLEIALFLLKSARCGNERAEFDRWVSVLQCQVSKFPNCLAEISYQRALMARVDLDYEAIEAAVDGIVGEDPVWALRQASLLADLKHFEKAEDVLMQAFRRLMEGVRCTPDSIYVLSRLAWIYWLLRRVKWSGRPELPQQLKSKILEFRCDPQDEMDSLKEAIGTHKEECLKNQNIAEPLFDVGHYKESAGLGGQDADFRSIAIVRHLSEAIGIPFRWKSTQVLSWFIERLTLSGCIDFDADGLGLILRSEFRYSSLTLSKSFSRLAVAKLPKSDVDFLVQAFCRAICYWRGKVGGAQSISKVWIVEEVGVLVEALSRIAIRVDPSEANNLVKLAVDLSRDPLADHRSLHEPLGHLIKYSISSMSTEEKVGLLFDVLSFPLPHEKSGNGAGVARSWPNPGVEEVGRDNESDTVNARINELLVCVKEKPISRLAALSRLLPLAEEGRLTCRELDLLSKHIWNGCPVKDLIGNVVLFRIALASVPIERVEEVRNEVCTALFDTSEESFLSMERLAGIINAAVSTQFPVRPNSMQAVEWFELMVSWRPKEDVDDVLGQVAQKNREIARAMGQALYSSIAPSLGEENLNEERFAALVGYWRDTAVPSIVASLPFFAGLGSKTAEEVEMHVRKGLHGHRPYEVGWAALALLKWKELAEEKRVPCPPHSLTSKLVYLIDSERIIGLPSLLYCANRMLQRHWLLDQEINILSGAVINIWGSFEYGVSPLDGDFAAATPLVRRRCVQLANSIYKILPSKGLEDIVLAANLDPLPEVRFALQEVDLEK